MADEDFDEDGVYQGWYNINPVSNNTARRILTDTSGRWNMTANYGNFRIYEERSQ